MKCEPHFFLRPGPNDQVLLDRLLTADLFSDPVTPDGLIIEAARALSYREVREKLPATTAVIVDPQAYRLQDDSYAEFSSLRKLAYCPTEGALTPNEFESKRFRRQFVRCVLDEQQRLGVTSYVAPAFFVDSSDSAWIDVNSNLLKETVGQAGQRVFATLCGSYSTLSRNPDETAVVQAITNCQVEGVLVLVSPIRALGDGPTKLSNYLGILRALGKNGAEVVACRQPAFGLSCMALGIAGFDCGVAAAESFDFKSITRPVERQAHDGSQVGKKAAGARKATVYLPQLLTSIPHAMADAILSTSGLAGSFVCNEPCCKEHVKGALLKSHEHFVYARFREVRELKNLPLLWRQQHLGQTLIASRQMADRVLRAFPNTPAKTFRHLDVWSRVLGGGSLERQATV
jgi:hypothetical protein